ncbi:MAG: hypothetical protein ACOX6D_08100 [Thermoguttaceae bacterium]|jgi:hypothetical protein
MKDRFSNFIESRQDPHHDPYEEDDDAYEEDESRQDAADDDVEEEVPAPNAPESRPFGSTLNLRFGGGNTQNNGSDQNSHNAQNGNASQNGWGEFISKPASPEVIRDAQQQGNRAPQQEVHQQPRQEIRWQPQPISVMPRQATPSPSPAAVEPETTEPARTAEPIDFSPIEEEEESPKRRGWHSILPGWRRKDEYGEDEDLTENLSQDDVSENDDEEELPHRFGWLSLLRRHRAQPEEEDTVSEKKFAHIGQRIRKGFSAVSNRVRGRLRIDESLDEFRQEIAADSDTSDENLRNRSGRLTKIGIAAGLASIIAMGGYAGVKHLNHGNKGNPETNQVVESTGKTDDTFGSLTSRAEEISAQAEGLGDALSDRLENTLQGVAEVVTSGGSIDDLLGDTDSANRATDALTDSLDAVTDTLDDSLDAASDALNSAAELAKTDSQTDPFDFDFGNAETTPIETAVADSPLDNDISNEPSTSPTYPAYGEGRGIPTPSSEDFPTMDQIKSDLAETGENIKEAIRSGLEKADSSLQTAGEKTGEFLSNTAERVNDSTRQLGENISSAYQNTKEKAADTMNELQNDFVEARDQIQSTAEQVSQQVGNSLQNVREQTLDSIQQFNNQIGGSLQSGTERREPLRLSLGQEKKSEPLFLSPTTRESHATSSLGENAVAQFQPVGTSADGRNTLLHTAAPATASVATPLATGNTGDNTQLSSLGPHVGLAPVSTPDTASAAAQEAALVQTQTPDETFATDPDLSSIGFEAPRVEGGSPLSKSLSPFGGQYSLPEEVVPAGETAISAAGEGQNATGLANNPNLSSLDYDPTNQNASAGYNNNNRNSYNLLNGESLSNTDNIGRADGPNNHKKGYVPASGYRQYKTKAGDNLIVIAENELGDGSRWSEISKLNSDKNLRGRLQEGITILLPTDKVE